MLLPFLFFQLAGITQYFQLVTQQKQIFKSDFRDRVMFLWMMLVRVL